MSGQGWSLLCRLIAMICYSTCFLLTQMDLYPPFSAASSLTGLQQPPFERVGTHYGDVCSTINCSFSWNTLNMKQSFLGFAAFVLDGQLPHTYNQKTLKVGWEDWAGYHVSRSNYAYTSVPENGCTRPPTSLCRQLGIISHLPSVALQQPTTKHWPTIGGGRGCMLMLSDSGALRTGSRASEAILSLWTRKYFIIGDVHMQNFWATWSQDVDGE